MTAAVTSKFKYLYNVSQAYLDPLPNTLRCLQTVRFIGIVEHRSRYTESANTCSGVTLQIYMQLRIEVGTASYRAVA